MKISIHWLKEYIPFQLPPVELADKLTMVGLEVEEISSVKSDHEGVLVGDILEVKKHPSADKLTVCKVKTGQRVLQIVCGAPNVQEGQRVAVATAGVTLPRDMRIQEKTIRGIQSQGMICSERELGLSDNHDGILVLDKNEYSVGDIFGTSLSSDTVLEINVTPNRPDCLSHLGIAREIGVITGEPLNKPDDEVKETDSSVNDWVKIEIADPVACPRYSVRIIRDVKVGPSPQWLKERIEAVGLRSINNVVDITNYVMYETGQPLHAFDYDLVQGRKIVVRKADKKEKFTTLNSEEHTLCSDDLLICDTNRGIALAGIMGGLNSEVSEKTQHILLESANFDSMTIRKTAKRLGLNSDASQRFERGADPNITVYAANRAAKLLAEIAGGQVAKGVGDVYPKKIVPENIILSLKKLKAILGIEVPKAKVFSILQGLELRVKNGDPIRVEVPTFRPDLKKEIDLVEEIIRHYGYDKIESKLSSNVPLDFQVNAKQDFSEQLKNVLTGFGFYETLGNSLVSEKHVSVFTPDRKPVVVENPLSPETACMRTMLIPSLLDAVQWNKNRAQQNLRLFEIGQVFWAKKGSLPDEPLFIAGVLSGMARAKPFWNEKTAYFNFFHLKGVLTTMFEHLHLDGIQFKSETHVGFQPETSISIYSGNQKIGLAGEIDLSLVKKWDIRDSVFGFEISADTLLSLADQTRKYHPIPRFPSINRDLSIVVDEAITASEIEKTIVANAGEMLTELELFDFYQGKQIPDGKKSLSFSMTFQSPVRTLQEEDVDPVMASILKNLENGLGASLRS
jgi:phenylalanyl-tRNA synthetase beta chain